MKKESIFWHLIHAFVILCLYIWMLFSLGKIPKIETEISELESEIETLKYHIEHSNDTIIINNYIQTNNRKR